MIHNMHKLLLFAAGLIILSSCIKDGNISPGTGNDALPAVVKIGTRSGPVDADDEIITLRIIAFQPGGMPVSNRFYDNLPRNIGVHEIGYEISTGTYDFVFIANENNGSELSSLTNYLGTKSGLENISLPSSLFSGVEVTSVLPIPIPMFLDVDNVEVLSGTQGVKVSGAPAITIWNIALKKLGVRMDMVLKSKIDLSSQFDGVRFSNLPDNVPLIGEYGGATWSTVKEYKISAGSLNFDAPYTLTTDDINNGYVWGVNMTRVILPSHLFTPKNNLLRLMKMEVILTGWNGALPSATIGHNGTTDYTLPPDTHYKAEGVIMSDAIPVHITPEAWTDVNVAGGVNYRMLNVSTTEVLFYDDNLIASTETIYFNSNQSAVTLETNAKNSSGGNVAVTSIFDTRSLNYDPATGIGSLQLRPLAAAGGIYTIYLSANGLVREIKVIVTTTGTHAQRNYSYVGAFYRYNQVGERRISIPGEGVPTGTSAYIAGDWVAVVNTGSSEWVKMDKEAFGSNSGVLVKSAKRYIYGTNSTAAQIKFRIGLTGAHPDGINAGLLGNATPRYALISIFYGTNLKSVHHIYVRQGEAADYLMRSIDPINITGTHALTMANRPNASRFTPYNLTDPNGGTGSTNFNNGATSYYVLPLKPSTNIETYFTDFPTKPGYFFKWQSTNNSGNNARKALNPTNPGTGNAAAAHISNYGNETTLLNWFWGTGTKAHLTHETCPQGFRRFSDNVGSHMSEYGNNRATSEMRQSLWLNPHRGEISHSSSGGYSSNNTDNSITGYLADGFFDMGGTIGASQSNTSSATPMPYTRVGSGSGIAYIGRLFYNPNTNASLFFPFTGFRKANEPNAPNVNGSTNSPGALVYTGFEGNYWSSTRLDDDNSPYSGHQAPSKAWRLSVGATWASASENLGGNAYPIRCIVGTY